MFLFPFDDTLTIGDQTPSSISGLNIHERRQAGINLKNTICMKKFLPILSLAFVMVACSTTPKEEAAPAPAVGLQLPPYNPDTAGLAEYQQWKAQNELAAKQPEAEAPAKVVYVQAAAPVARAAKKPAVKRQPAPKAAAPAPASTETAPANDGVAIADESVNEAKAPVKEGWSKAAKGSAIGAGAGAAAGAIISKRNRVLGGVIGGVVGGAVGYGIGRGMDKKDGRY